MKSFLQKKKINIIIWLVILFFNVLTGINLFNYLYNNVFLQISILYLFIVALYLILAILPGTDEVTDFIECKLLAPSPWALPWFIICGINCYILYYTVVILVLTFLRDFFCLPDIYDYFIINFLLSVGILGLPFAEENK